MMRMMCLFTHLPLRSPCCRRSTLVVFDRWSWWHNIDVLWYCSGVFIILVQALVQNHGWWIIKNTPTHSTLRGPATTLASRNSEQYYHIVWDKSGQVTLIELVCCIVNLSCQILDIQALERENTGVWTLVGRNILYSHLKVENTMAVGKIPRA